MFPRLLALQLTAALCFVPNVVLARDAVQIRIAWRDLEPMVRGQDVSVETPSGVRLSGRALTVDNDSLVLDVRKTSDRRAYPKGRALVARTAIQDLKMTRYVGNGRRFGKLIGGAVGLVAGLIAAVAIGFQENPETVGRRKVYIGLLIPGSLVGGLLGGYALGRAADREITIIRIIPE